MTQIAIDASDLSFDITANLHRWRAFVAVTEIGSLTRAALHLDVDQSVLSRRINGLERDCNARLFTRTGRGVELSEMGARILPHAKRLLFEAWELEGELRHSGRAASGQVTIVFPASLGSVFIHPLFSLVRERCPEIQLKIVDGGGKSADESIACERADIAIVQRFGGSPPEEEQVLAHMPIYLIGPEGDALTRQGTVQVQELDGQSFVLPANPNGLRGLVERVTKDRGIALRIASEAESPYVQKIMVEQERLYAILPLYAVWSELREGRLQNARLVSPGIEETLNLVLSKSKRPGSAVTEVASAICGVANDLAIRGFWRTGARAGSLSA